MIIQQFWVKKKKEEKIKCIFSQLKCKVYFPTKGTIFYGFHKNVLIYILDIDTVLEYIFVSDYLIICATEYTK